MSGKQVRTTIKTFLEAEFPDEKFVDLTGQFSTIDDMLEEFQLTRNDSWIGVEFVGDDEFVVSLSADTNSGCYREVGSIILHIVEVATLGVGQKVVDKAESIRNKLRGRRISNILLDSVSPPNFDASRTLQFEGGFIAAAISTNYRYDFTLNS